MFEISHVWHGSGDTTWPEKPIKLVGLDSYLDGSTWTVPIAPSLGRVNYGYISQNTDTTAMNVTSETHEVYSWDGSEMHLDLDLLYVYELPTIYGFGSQLATFEFQLVSLWMPNSNGVTTPTNGWADVDETSIIVDLDVSAIFDKVSDLMSTHFVVGRYLHTMIRTSGITKKLGKIRVGIRAKIPGIGAIRQEAWVLHNHLSSFFHSTINTMLVTAGDSSGGPDPAEGGL